MFTNSHDCIQDPSFEFIWTRANIISSDNCYFTVNVTIACIHGTKQAIKSQTFSLWSLCCSNGIMLNATPFALVDQSACFGTRSLHQIPYDAMFSSDWWFISLRHYGKSFVQHWKCQTLVTVVNIHGMWNPWKQASTGKTSKTVAILRYM